MEKPDLSELGLSDKEQKILEAAITVFSEKGFSAATTSEIAKNAGVAEGTIFRYFKTKKDILRGIVIQTISLASTKLVITPIEKIFKEAGDKDLRTVLKEVLMDRISLINRMFPMIRVIITEAVFHEDVREALFQNIISRALATITDFHKLMLERNLIRSEVDPETMLRCIVGNMAVYIMQRKVFPDKFGPSNLETDIDKMLDIILFGISRTS